MASSVPGPVPLPDSRYDLGTFMGRVRHCMDLSDPTMLLSTATDISNAKRLVWDYRNGVEPSMTPALWRAKKVLDSSVHPDTGETVFLPFRMSCCVLSNLVVTAGMLTPGLGPAGTVFWQIANQSLNVAVNTANANKSHPMTTKQLVTNYFLAVGASCGVALGLNSIVPKLKNISPSTRTVLSRLVPFAAVVSAGIVNVFLMRSEEIKKGISVFDNNGDVVGTSKRAAVQAVSETAASRVINATPIMVLPSLALLQLQKTVLKGKSIGLVTGVNLGLIYLTSIVALPFALAVFPQKTVVSASSLEPEFSNKKDKNGLEIKELWFNRGI